MTTQFPAPQAAGQAMSTMTVRQSLERGAHGKALCAIVSAEMMKRIPASRRTVQRLLNAPIGEWEMREASALAAALGGVPLDHLRPKYLHLYNPADGSITTFQATQRAGSTTDITTQPTEAVKAGKV